MRRTPFVGLTTIVFWSASALALSARPALSEDPHVHEHAHGSGHVHADGDAPGFEVQGRTVRVGKYVVELRVPDGGLFPGAETDIEFRVTDATQKDPVEDGFKGVANIAATGVISMPSMPGMPEAKPEIHREGVPGEYGIVAYFPHGGDFRIVLTLTPPGDKPFRASFDVGVADKKRATEQDEPYSLKVIDWPKTAEAGKSVDLHLVVVDSKTGASQAAFDIVHEKQFHLFLASKDFGWFLHEHPIIDPSGTWTLPVTFPAGGEYWVYGDVAPSGKGSRILSTSVSVTGKPPTWDTRLVPSRGPSADGGLVGRIEPLENPIPIGSMTTIRVRLFDEKTGKPAGDTEPWLGAAGHLMIFHEDGQTVVHSHPKEDAESAGLVKKGEVSFTARFPKAGLYRAYAQFQRAGEIKTLGFVLDVT